MDTQTTQAFGNENKKNQGENKDMKWAKAAKVAGAAAAVAGVGGLAASVLGGDESQVAEAQEEALAQANAEEQLMQDQHPEAAETQSQAQSQYQAHAHESAAAQAAEPVRAAASQPHSAAQASAQHANTAAPAQPAQAQHAPAAPAAAHDVHHDNVAAPAETMAETHVDAAGFVADANGLPVDEQWLANNDSPAQPANDAQTTQPAQPANNVEAANSAAALNQEIPPLSQSAMNILSSGVGDDLADTVNVSPEIFMSMMGLKPADMVQTELNGDGQTHMAALLANDNGQYMLLVDSDGDGFLDTLTDMTGHEYAALGGGIHFEVNVGEMQAFVHEINPETLADTSMYASSGAEITAIEGNGEGEEVAYVDEHDIIDTPDDSHIDSTLETAMDSNTDDLFDNLVPGEELASNDEDLNTDLIGFDDSSMA